MSHVRRTTALAMLLSLLSIPCAAQVRGGVKAGAAFTSLSNIFMLTDGEEEESDVHTSLIGGGFLELGLGPRVSFQPEFLFATKGAQLPEDSEGDAVLLRYLEMPLLVRVAARANGTGGYFVAGPQIGVRLSTAFSGTDTEVDIDDRVKRTDWGLTFGLGVQTDHWLLEGRVGQGLKNIATDYGYEVKTRSVAVLTGWRF